MVTLTKIPNICKTLGGKHRGYEKEHAMIVSPREKGTLVCSRRQRRKRRDLKKSVPACQGEKVTPSQIGEKGDFNVMNYDRPKRKKGGGLPSSKNNSA